MSVRVIVSVVAPGWGEALPGAQTIATKAARAALRERGPGVGASQAELGVVLADDETLRGLNRDYRGQDKTTNVLAFAQGGAPSHLPPGVHPLGDVVIGLGVAAREAAEQNKPLADHLTHLVVHGVLHLCGDDHVAAPAAADMEARERRILAGLGVGDPYEALDAAPAA